MRERKTRAARISQTECRLFGGTPAFLLGRFARHPRIYTKGARRLHFIQRCLPFPLFEDAIEGFVLCVGALSDLRLTAKHLAMLGSPFSPSREKKKRNERFSRSQGRGHTLPGPQKLGVVLLRCEKGEKNQNIF